MRVLSKIDDMTYVVRLNEGDLKEGTFVHVAHDYLSISTRSFMENLDGSSRWNEINGKRYHGTPVRKTVTINIRDLIDIVLPFLNEHPNCQREHLKFPATSEYAGKDAYLYHDTDITTAQIVSDHDMVSVVEKKHYTRKHGEKVYQVEKKTITEDYHNFPTDKKETKRKYEISINDINQ